MDGGEEKKKIQIREIEGERGGSVYIRVFKKGQGL